MDELYRLSAKDDVRWEYEAREKTWRDERARLNFATNEGRGEILDLLESGMSPADILRQYKRL